MSEETFKSELERALARSDVDELLAALAGYFRWHEDGSPMDSDHVIDDRIYEVDDKERSLAIVMLAMDRYESESFLGLVSAGPLEDIFFMEAALSDEFLARIEAEATSNARFRWMLSGMYTSSFRPECTKLVERLTYGVSLEDPLPPRPEI